MSFSEEYEVMPQLHALQRALRLTLPVTYVTVPDQQGFSIDCDEQGACHILFVPAYAASRPIAYLGDISYWLCYFKLCEDVDPNFAYLQFSRITEGYSGPHQQRIAERQHKFSYLWHFLTGIWASDIQFRHWRSLFEARQHLFIQGLLAKLQSPQGGNALRNMETLLAFVQFLVLRERHMLPPLDVRRVRGVYPELYNTAIDDLVRFCRCIPRLKCGPTIALLTFERWAQTLSRKIGFTFVPCLRKRSGDDFHSWLLLPDMGLLFPPKKDAK